ncbi:MAG: TonB-dependent receptor [Rhodospirillaceae bacterium]
MRIILLAAAAAAVTVAGYAGPVRAQAMNYGELQEMFGEPVTTSATGSPQRVADAPVNMEIITADEIRRSGADNIPDILRSVAGVDVRRYGAADADVAIRGYNAANSPRVLVLLNGRQIYVDYHSYTAWATLPVQLEEIRQIEVIKGPNTALFGFNAMAGVINIVTFDPIFDTVNTVTARVGTQSNQQLSSVVTAHLGNRAGLRLSASEHGRKELSSSGLPPSYGPFPRHSYNRSVYAHGRAELPAGIDVSAEVDVTEAKLLEMTVGGFPGWTSYRSNREKIGIGTDSPIGYLNLNAYRNYVEFDYTPGENCVTCTSIVNSLMVVQVSDLLKPGVDHTVRLGLEYRNNRGGGTAFAGERFGFDVYAANAMWNWQVTPAVALTNSVRVDHMTFTYKGPVAPTVRYTAADYNSKPITEPSFNSAAVYKPTPRDSFRLSVARGVQAPDFYALFPEPIQVGFNTLVNSYQGTPNLKPTISMNYEFDYERSLPSIDSSVQMALFYQTSQHVLAPPGDAGITDAAGNGYAGNIGRSTSIGGEISLKGADAGGWRWKAAYALAMIRDHYSVNLNPGLPDSSVDSQRGTPTSTVILGLGRSWRDFEFDLTGRWQSRYDDIGVSNDGTALTRYRIDNFITLDGRIGYKLNDKLTLAVSGQQINQARLTQTSGPPVERRVLGTVSVRF